ncbi:3'5'-cyclic nucleotide phosphodiesterase family protein [Tritrichomonas foetus]|uniref:3'5'-cyclic nucleotide phosphodiesterase family protein n=1 Tax=Tritrichomonas foetus TaxID=1144522 RepID=A0A1J4KI88_9EUKA|nr:3'5'-cyclic nucleotide phosphodiesterase family protein [Tritrichomonas foetus]|eukprot:OHT09398.1 3'5'-cyclic nucleotide phosphodiesterase family protein [Tritrichomonas foetus]
MKSSHNWRPQTANSNNSSIISPKQFSNSLRPYASTNHSFVSTFNDSVPPSPTADQFTPALSRKLTGKRSSHNITKPNHLEFATNFEKVAYLQNSKPKHKYPHHSLEKLFDDIASNSFDQPLNKLAEEYLRSFFRVENVSFFHDISSVSSLYCPSNSVVFPHGSGLIGYCHFSRKILNIKCANTHVSFSPIYDGKICQANSRLLIFPLFDYQGHVKSVVQMIRPASLPSFDDEDEKAIEYLQNKFQIYSRWLFQPIPTESTFTELVLAQRLGDFVESMTTKLERIFNCRTAEIWEFNKEEQEIHMFVPCASMPLPIPLADSGVVGFALSNATTISLIASNMHAAYNSRTDGNGEQSVLVVPVKDPVCPRVYGLVLRGKRLPHFFTDTDEKILAKIASVVVASLNSSEVVERSFQSLEDSMRAQKRLQSLLEVAETLSGQLHIDELIPSIMTRACDLVKADRCSLFMVNETREKLTTSFHGGLSNAIEIPINAGIVGYTATTGQILNIKDAYEDPRFNRATDLSTGYRTHNLLCVPIYDDKNEIRGVTEMINKIDGVFTKEDEKLIQVFNVFVGISIENARLYRASIDLSLQLRSVLEISQSIAQSNTIKKLSEDILKNSRKVIGAGRAMIFLTNSSEFDKFDIFAIDEDIEAKMRRVKQANEQAAAGKLGARRALIHKMMAGGDSKTLEELEKEDYERNQAVSTVISTSEPLLVNKNDDPNESMIISPIKGSDRSMMGAVLMQWKKRETLFNTEDLKMLESFSVFLSISLERSRMKAQAVFGAMEVELRQTFNESERKLPDTTEKLFVTQEETKLMVSRSFNSIDFDEFKLIFSFFDLLGVRPAIPIPNETLYCFIYQLRDNMSDTFLHNWDHARDTAQFLVHMLVNGQISKNFSPREKFVMLVSCLSHDVGYNDRSNIIIPLNILHNNKSSIESHHISTLIHIIAKNQCNVFSVFNENRDLEEVWRQVVNLILGTDMTLHFNILDAANEAKLQDRQLSRGPANRLLLMKLLIKACDISALARPFEYADKVKDCISDEFYKCGDMSRIAGVRIGNSKTKDNEEREKEANFFNFVIHVCIPIFKEIISIFPSLKYLIDQIHSNMDKWKLSIE